MIDKTALASLENRRPRFMKELASTDPYGRSRFYGVAVKTADFEELEKLIGICGMLQPTKIYLFWSAA